MEENYDLIEEHIFLKNLQVEVIDFFEVWVGLCGVWLG
jgi:hypothetical protein